MLNAIHTRRSFIGSVTTASLLGVGDLSVLSKLSLADEGKPVNVKLTSDIAVLFKLIENTPREKLVGAMIEKLRKGATTNQFVAAMFLAAARMNVSPHRVYMIHSALRMSTQMEPEHRLLPLFWALDLLPYRRKAGDRYSFVNVSGKMSAAQATEELHGAMDHFDWEKSQVAIIHLSRTTNPKTAMGELWKYAGRNDSVIGHRAIALANSYRVLETIGWEHSEPIFQFVVRVLNGGKHRHRQHQANWQRSHEQFGSLPDNWVSTNSEHAATLELFEVMRAGDDASACEAAFAMLAGGRVTAGSVWDAVYLLGADFMIRFPSSAGINGSPLHTNTSANALRCAFDACADPNTRLYTLLAAVAWATNFYGVWVERKVLRDLKITEIPLVDVSDSPQDAVAEIFARQPKRRYDETQKESLSGNVGSREEMDRVAELAFSYATKHADHSEFLRSARLITSIKSTQDAHDMKFPAAIFENYDLVDARWRPHLLAASTHYLHGTQMVDNPAVHQAMEALG